MPIWEVYVKYANKGNPNKAYRKIIKIPEVKGAHSIFGEYDLVVKVEAKNNCELSSIVTNKIRSLKDIVKNTKTSDKPV